VRRRDAPDSEEVEDTGDVVVVVGHDRGHDPPTLEEVSRLSGRRFASPSDACPRLDLVSSEGPHLNMSRRGLETTSSSPTHNLAEKEIQIPKRHCPRAGARRASAPDKIEGGHARD
jgi:hypothetical protein